MGYRFQTSSKINSLTKLLDQQSFFIQQFSLTSAQSQNIRRSSTLKSSLFSARIEGNLLTLDQVTIEPIGTTRDLQKLEVTNILTALNYIYSSRPPQKLTTNLIQTLHNYVINHISPTAGRFRTEQTAIFNQAGVAVFLTPPPDIMHRQLRQFIQDANTSGLNLYIQTAITHYTFEKIHPFVDGNGRVGRLITQFQLDRAGKRFKGLLAFEEQIDHFRSEYYSLLQQDTNDITAFIEFFLETLSLSAKQSINALKSTSNPSPLDSMLPRRKEIYFLIKDHQYLSFDQIHRRFMAVNQSTLRYDLTQLIKQGLIHKLGSTKGVLYSPKPESTI